MTTSAMSSPLSGDSEGPASSLQPIGKSLASSCEEMSAIPVASDAMASDVRKVASSGFLGSSVDTWCALSASPVCLQSAALTAAAELPARARLLLVCCTQAAQTQGSRAESMD
eukprot:CAMPEP_0172667360 /NCGR_PEP_ID=MMETSP1074-20121228/8374_1 /TAXON_ID=2916 /ORGANISM="Ceratium fusus, Strain PA161109" /LENGTH=112 /DNA_ID=CAMNT_0013483851 /DNA_START=560 /DNA_END=898 /DNA_ORIENTATION=+